MAAIDEQLRDFSILGGTADQPAVDQAGSAIKAAPHFADGQGVPQRVDLELGAFNIAGIAPAPLRAAPQA